MGHNLRAIIGKPPVMEAMAQHYRAVVRVRLSQGFEMVPVGDRLHDELELAPDASNPEAAVNGFSFLGGTAERVLARLSEVSPIAYVYTEYFGGVGEQAGVAFVRGEAVTRGGGRGRVLPWSSSIGPINEALAAIGVVREGSHDEFDAVGLRHYRQTDDWVVDDL
ncbi:MAG: hypothetical protein KDB73_07010 [Planctomycetes bacterium]|nr:hypothetical protein [Planctomycetota bacterium]